MSSTSISSTKIRYFGYCRKSTDEKDKQIMSIDQQIEELKTFALRENLEIVEYFTESKTAKVPGRKVFSNLLKLVEKGYAQGIVAWHPDRIARNSVDGGHVIYLLDTGKLQSLKFPTFWFENTPQGRFMLNIAFGQAKYYVDTLSENVARGLHFRARRGEWPGIAPLGYRNDRNTRSIKIDKFEAPLVKNCFEKFASGDFSSLRDIRNFLFESGVKRRNSRPLHYNQIRRMLSRTFYYGLINYAGETSEGKHIPLISKDLFNRVQERLVVDYSKPKPQKHEFAFTGFIKCSECGGYITAEKHTKHYKKTARTAEYVYYRCSKKRGVCSQPYLTESSVDTQLRELIMQVSLNQMWEKNFLEFLAEDERKAKIQISSELAKLSSSLEAVEKKLDKLLESFLDEVVDTESYQLKKNQLLQRKLSLQSQLKEVKANGSNWLEPMREFINVSADADKITREKENRNSLATVAKKVGSNYMLNNGRVTYSPNPAALSLAARATAARESTDSLQMWTLRDSNP